MTDGLIGDDEMGDVWPSVHPGRGLDEYGSARIESRGPFTVRSFQTIALTYTVGRFGLDDSGSIKVVQRSTHDGGRLQVDDPAAMNFVTAHASNGCQLEVMPEPAGHQRPWDRSLRVFVRRGSMHPGDTITVTYGDCAGGSPGLRLPTFCETAHEFRVLGYLMQHRGKVVSRSELIDHIYAQDFDRDSNTVEVFIGRIRKKTHADLIETVRGLGYRINE